MSASLSHIISEKIAYSQSALADNGEQVSLAALWPHQIVRLLEMVEVSATDVMQLLQSVAAMESLFEQIVKTTDAPLTEKSKEAIGRLMVFLESHADKLGLTVPKVWAKEFTNKLQQAEVKCSEAHQWFARIQEAIKAELSGRFFMYIPSNMIHYYSDKNLFGEEVENKLPSVSSDIAESGRCLALGRFTACVLHLMRVTETGARSFGTSLGLVLNPRDGMDAVLQQANHRIQALPTSTPQEMDHRSACEQLHASLHAVRIAWRNPTMHGIDRSYIEEEAREIWDCSKAFMRRLAGVLP
jgi:hypothetical protein